MLKHYIVSAWRNTWVYGKYTLLSMLALGMGWAVFITVLVYVNRENSYDRWHPQLAQVYRVNTEQDWGGYEITPFSSSGLGGYMQNQVPEVMAGTTFRELGEMAIKIGQQEFYDRQLLAVDSNFFKVFPYRFTAGNPSEALHRPNQAVISEIIRERWFGKDNPIGATFEMNGQTFTVSGVFEKTAPSHLDIHVCLSKTFDQNNWNAGMYNNYIRLKPNTNKRSVENKITNAYIYNLALAQQSAAFSPKESKTVAINDVKDATAWLASFMERKNIQVSLEEVADIHLKPKVFGWQDEPLNHPVLDYSEGNQTPVVVFSIIAVLVLLLASFNYMNIAIAIGNEQAKNSGLRKIIGANKKQLMLLSLTTSALQVLFATVVGLLWSHFAISYLNANFGTDLELWSSINLQANLQMLGQVLLIILTITLLIGLYPAIILTRFKPIQLLKGSLKQGRSGLGLRNTLLVVQFVLAIAFIASMLVIQRQVQYMQKNDPGFADEQVLRINGENVPIDFYTSLDEQTSLINDIKALTEVETIATTHFYPGKASFSMQTAYIGAQKDSLSMRANWVGLGYFETLSIAIKQGRAFSRDFSTDTVNAAIINETAVNVLGLQDPIGQKVSALAMEYTIVGVVKDIHAAGYEKIIEPELYVIGSAPGLTGGRKQLLVKFKNGLAAQRGLMKINDIWRKVDQSGPMRYSWIKDDFAALLKKYSSLGKLISILTFLAVGIAIMGVFTLSAFIVQRRTKEIGIRKVLGADVFNIVHMLSKDFARLILLAIVIALPIAIWAMHTWLADFAYRIDLAWWIFALAGVIAMVIALITVGSQAMRAALANPVDSLRDE